jgi:hypothetical protein
MSSATISKKLFKSNTFLRRSDAISSDFKFVPGNFYSGLAKTPTGKEIRKLLLSDGAVLVLTGAALAAPSRPPIAALTPFMAEHVGEDAFEDQYKRFTGHCVRQLMEHLGAKFGGNKPIIAKGSRYATGAKYTFGSVAPRKAK